MVRKKTLKCCFCFRTYTGDFKILYFGDNDLLLLQFRPDSNNSKNRSEHFGHSQK